MAMNLKETREYLEGCYPGVEQHWKRDAFAMGSMASCIRSALRDVETIMPRGDYEKTKKAEAIAHLSEAITWYEATFTERT